MRFSDDFERTNSAAVPLRIACSSLRRSFISRSVGEAEHALGDDVQLHLRRAAFDRVGPRAQPFARCLELSGIKTLAFPAERLRSEDGQKELVAALVDLGAVVLEDR